MLVICNQVSYALEFNVDFLLHLIIKHILLEQGHHVLGNTTGL